MAGHHASIAFLDKSGNHSREVVEEDDGLERERKRARDRSDRGKRGMDRSERENDGWIGAREEDEEEEDEG